MTQAVTVFMQCFIFMTHYFFKSVGFVRNTVVVYMIVTCLEMCRLAETRKWNLLLLRRMFNRLHYPPDLKSFFVAYTPSCFKFFPDFQDTDYNTGFIKLQHLRVSWHGPRLRKLCSFTRIRNNGFSPTLQLFYQLSY